MPKPNTRRIPVFLCLTLSVLFAGCAAPRVPPELRAPYGPVLSILHFPFPPPDAAAVARPQPDRSGWTNGRMELDLRRMGAARLDVVFVALDVPRVRGFHAERLSQFAQLAAQNAEAPQLAVWLRAAPDTKPAALRRLISLLVRSGAPSSVGWFRLEGRPLLVIEGQGPLLVRHPAFTFRRAGDGTGDWVAPSGPQNRPAFGAEGEQALISAGYWSGKRGAWLADRNQGRAFREQLWAAAVRRPKIIVISSWDDFTRGDFLMPNTLDGEKAYRHLLEEGRWLNRFSPSAAAATSGGP